MSKDTNKEFGMVVGNSLSNLFKEIEEADKKVQASREKAVKAINEAEDALENFNKIAQQ